MMPKPGVMFYFEVRPCLKRLNLEEKGQLFEAILDYGEYGIEPSLEGMAGLAWDFLQPKLDRDATRYDRQIEQRQYAVYVRESKKKNMEPLSFDDWKASHDIGEEQPISSDIGRYPNLILQTTNPILQTDIKADKPPKPARHKYGEYQNVMLTDEEYEKLKSEIPEYQDMIERLSSYIASSGKKYKNHLATMRNWYRKEQQQNGKTESKPLWTVGTTV